MQFPVLDLIANGTAYWKLLVPCANADLVVVHGTVTRKMAPRLRWIYDQMPEPKYCIAMGACSITGGVYFDSYNVLPGVDQVVPVDVYVPGCPPRPEELIDAFLLLQDKIRKQTIR